MYMYNVCASTAVSNGEDQLFTKSMCIVISIHIVFHKVNAK